MPSRTRALLIVATIAFVTVAGWLAMRSGLPLVARSGVTEEASPPADRVGKLIPFEERQERRLAEGKFRVLEQNRRFSVVANEAWRIEILEALADRGDFTLLDYVRRHPFVSLDVRDEPIEQVLSQVVRDTPYAIRYALEGDGAGLWVDSVEVGIERDADDWDGELDEGDRDSGEKTVRRAKPADVAKRGARERRRPAPRPEADRRLAMERREQREADRHDRYLEELENADPEVRAWAASALDFEDPRDLIPLGELLGNDPDPAVRAEIAYHLGFGDPGTSVPLLVSALEDPAPGVVAAAADALGFLDDRSVIDDLQALRDSESESVREAARGALGMLEGAE